MRSELLFGCIVLLIEVISEDRVGQTKRLVKAHDAKLGQLKAELRGLLKQPLVARGVSTRYVTSGNHPIAHDMLAGECRWFQIPTARCISDRQADREGMIGVRRTEAGNDIAPRKGRTVKKEKGKDGMAFEEWTGIS